MLCQILVIDDFLFDLSQHIFVPEGNQRILVAIRTMMLMYLAQGQSPEEVGFKPRP